jgi:hypothetical protein
MLMVDTHSCSTQHILTMIPPVYTHYAPSHLYSLCSLSTQHIHTLMQNHTHTHAVHAHAHEVQIHETKQG